MEKMIRFLKIIIFILSLLNIRIGFSDEDPASQLIQSLHVISEAPFCDDETIQKQVQLDAYIDQWVDSEHPVDYLLSSTISNEFFLIHGNIEKHGATFCRFIKSDEDRERLNQKSMRKRNSSV